MKKCTRCGKKFEDTVEYKGKRYCNECYNEFLNLKANCSVCKTSFIRKHEYTCDDMEAKYKKKNFCSQGCYHTLVQERLDLDELDLWLKQYYKTDKLNNRIYMQISQFRSKNNFTYRGILLTLKYITLTLKKPLESETIGIVAWYYDSAREDYVKKIKKQERDKSLSNFTMFLNNEHSHKVSEYREDRVDKILITDINFNDNI